MPRPPRPTRVLVALLLALAASGALAVGAHATRAATPASTKECNGSAALCDRRIDEVVFATTHNSMANRADGFRKPNQLRSTTDQWEHGIRGMQIDVHSGFPRGDRVSTDLTGGQVDTSTLPRSLVRAANLIHDRLGAPAAGLRPGLYLCHVFCEIGAKPLLDTATALERFLRRHPNEVMVVVIEDYVAPAAILAVLEQAGLGELLLPVTPGQPLPTLGEMVASGHRLFVTLERGEGGPTLANAFANFVEETPFHFTRTSALTTSDSCAPHRGTDDGPVFQFNHWLTPAAAPRGQAVNGRILRDRVERCIEERGKLPTLLAVDFAETGRVVELAEELNARG